MHKKSSLIWIIIVFILGLLLFFLGIFINFLLIFISLILLLIGIGLLMYWSTANFIWTCRECGTNFKISLFENVFGINAGVNYKELYCPNCNTKKMCDGHFI